MVEIFCEQFYMSQLNTSLHYFPSISTDNNVLLSFINFIDEFKKKLLQYKKNEYITEHNKI